MTGSMKILLVGSLTLCFAASVASATTDSVRYWYYPNGRLQSATYANGTTIIYVYDPAGNRQSVVTTCSASGC